jgi:transcriptional regulator with XRE-family HTH domain/tetratricopeptide (TPR) repeat protein
LGTGGPEARYRLMEATRVTFGKVLREKRIGRGLTQKELAELANVDDSYISQLERDYKFPSARTIESLAQALGVEVADLLAMYFPAAEAKPTTAFVGGREAVAAFEECLAGAGGVLVIRGGPGSGKTALINERIIPKCRDEKVPYIYFDSRLLTSYRGFLKDLRDAFASRRGGYRTFDEIFEQCGSIERRLRGRFQDPFSLQVAGGGAEAAPEAELTYAEKYIYREAERLLTDEFLAGWRSSSRDVRRAVVILDDFHGVSATVGYWVGQFLERLAEVGVLGDRLLFVMAVRPPRALGAAAAVRNVRTLELKPLTPAEVEEYVHARRLKLAEAEWELVSSLGGDVRALKLWGDYFEAAALFGKNRLGLAEDELRTLDEELAPLVAEDGFTKGRLLLMETRRLLGHLTRLQGRLAEAADYYVSAASLAEGLADARAADLGYLYLDLGHVYRHRGRWDEAIDNYVRAGEEFAGCGEEIGAGVAHSSMGTAFRLKRKFARAKQEYRQASNILEGLAAREDGAEARRWLASTLSNYGITLRLEAEELAAAGETAAAHKALQKAKAMCEEAITVSDDAAETAVAENRYGLCLFTASRWLQGEAATAEAAEALAEATRRHKRALSVFEDLGDHYRVAQVFADLGVAAAQQGLVHDAIINFKNGLAIFQQMGSRYHAAKVLVELGLLSEGGEQLSYFAEALAAARGHNDESLAEIAGAVKAALLAGDAARARRFFEEQKAADPVLGPFFDGDA